MLNWIVIAENEVIASFASREDAKSFTAGKTGLRIASISALIAL